MWEKERSCCCWKLERGWSVILYLLVAKERAFLAEWAPFGWLRLCKGCGGLQLGQYNNGGTVPGFAVSE